MVWSHISGDISNKGDFVSWDDVECEAARQREKPPSDVLALGAELRKLLRARQVTVRSSRIGELLREQGDWSDPDLEALFQGLVHNGVVHTGGNYHASWNLF